MSVTAIAVEDMHCAACARKIEGRLAALPLVRAIKFNEIRRHVVVDHDERLQTADLIDAIEASGYSPALLGHAHSSDQDRTLLKRLGIAGLAAMQVMMVHIALYAGLFSGIEAGFEQILEFTALLFCIPVVSYSALPFYLNGLVRLHRGLNMDTPIALAVVIAFAVSFYNTLGASGEVYYDSVVMFTFLMLGARYLDQRLRLRLTLEDTLLGALPKLCTLVAGDGLHAVPSRTVKPRDLLWIDEGGQLPVDGTLNDERAVMEEASVTGESAWRVHVRNDLLYAGTFNRGPAFRMTAATSADDSCLAEINRLAIAALDRKHSMTRLADRVARVFIPVILIVATTTYVAWHWFDPSIALSAALAVLVVSCPCALSLATPAAISAALARLRQAGILVKNSSALERLPAIRTVYFDKTGTLTAPNLTIASTTTLADLDEDECLSLAATLQAHSSHPLARAFAGGRRKQAQNVDIVASRGVSGEVDGHAVRVGSAGFCGFDTDRSDMKTVQMSVDSLPAATFQIAQPIRGDAKATVAQLQRDHLEVRMSSGDDETQCRAVAEALGITFQADQLPQGKVDAIRDCAGPVMFVGDGINDVPALANASVSAAMMETNDLVKSKADVILLTGRLSALIDLFRICRRTRSVITENLLWAVAYNMIAIPLAIFGFAPPWAAAIGMSLSSILVMLNAGRVLLVPIRQTASQAG